MFSTFLRGNGETFPKKIICCLKVLSGALPTQSKLKKVNFNMFLMGNDETLRNLFTV